MRVLTFNPVSIEQLAKIKATLGIQILGDRGITEIAGAEVRYNYADPVQTLTLTVMKSASIEFNTYCERLRAGVQDLLN